MKKIKVAQIGTSQNSHGGSVWRRLLRHSDIFEVVGFAFPENEREKFPEAVKAFDGEYLEMRNAKVEAIKQAVMYKMKLFGSVNKA